MRYSLLVTLGWTESRDTAVPAFIASHNLSTACVPARVTRHDRRRWTLATELGEAYGELRGRLRETLDSSSRPTVGDWVLVTLRADEAGASIEAVLPRSSALERTAPGRVAEAQILAANIDAVLVCVPGDAPENPRRLERQLAMVWNSGAEPVVVLTKRDLASDVSWVPAVVAGASIVSVDSLAGDGLDELDPWLVAGSTLAVIGPSGAGKSTLANALLGRQALATGHVRTLDQRGRHTTTWRELVVLPSGALLIDTPGIRELALWDAGGGLSVAFDDVAAFASICRFSDCRHGNEPGCAVRAALASGQLAEDRFAHWQGLERELAFQARRVDARLASAEKKKWAAIAKEARGRSRR